MKEKVAVLGANESGGYATIAFRMLKEYGHTPIPVNPTLQMVEKVRAHKSLASLIGEHIDTLTLYVNPKILEHYVSQIIEVNPRRVIFNPGTESPAIEAKLKQAGISTMHACTMVLLRSNQFETAESDTKGPPESHDGKT